MGAIPGKPRDQFSRSDQMGRKIGTSRTYDTQQPMSVPGNQASAAAELKSLGLRWLD
jgi:hypothetical protein